MAVGVTDDPMELRGKLKRVSPEELPHALLLRIGDQIEEGVSEDRLREWRHTLLSASFHFKHLESDDSRYWESVRAREHLVVDCSAMARDAIQRIYELVSFKVKQEKKTGKLSSQQIADLYCRHGDLAKSAGEEITKHMVENALAVHANVLSTPALLQVLQKASAKWGKSSPFNSVMKLFLINQKCKEISRTHSLAPNASAVWVLAGIVDWVLAGMVEAAEIGKRQIKGEGSGGKGIVDLLLFKFRLRSHLTQEFLDHKALRADTKDMMRQAFLNHESYRRFCGYPKDTNHDLSWQAGWPASSLQCCRLIEQMVFGVEYDKEIKTAVRGLKSIEETLEMQTITDFISQIDEDLEAEAEAAGSSSTPAVAVVAKGSSGICVGLEDEEDEHAVIVVENQQKLSADDVEQVKRFKDMAARMIRQQARFVVEPDSAKRVAEEINTTKPFQEIKDDAPIDRIVLFVYDLKTSGESVTNPQTRKPPLRPHFKKMIGGAIASRASETELNKRDVFLLFDAGKHGRSLCFTGRSTGRESLRTEIREDQ